MVKLLGKTLNFTAFQSRVLKLWCLDGDADFIDIGLGYYIVKFDIMSDFIKVLTEGPWKIVDHYLPIQRWKPEFRPSKAKLGATVVWGSNSKGKTNSSNEEGNYGNRFSVFAAETNAEEVEVAITQGNNGISSLKSQTKVKDPAAVKARGKKSEAKGIMATEVPNFIPSKNLLKSNELKNKRVGPVREQLTTNQMVRPNGCPSCSQPNSQY
ncbi:hypothetical protein REPUB_Repub12eG0065300 [Reevesia pubescens]